MSLPFLYQSQCGFLGIRLLFNFRQFLIMFFTVFSCNFDVGGGVFSVYLFRHLDQNPDIHLLNEQPLHMNGGRTMQSQY